MQNCQSAKCPGKPEPVNKTSKADPPKILVAVPIFNEAKTLHSVLDRIKPFAESLLVVDDGSTDSTAQMLRERKDIQVLTHSRNRGSGAALSSAVDYCVRPPQGVGPFSGLITIDCDGQHEPERIGELASHLSKADIVSASRYLTDFPENDSAPPDRRKVNQEITALLNRALDLGITDAFCGFKAYRTSALEKLRITETGWGMPLQVWVQAKRLGLRIEEIPIPRIYLDPNRTFGTGLTDPGSRLMYYHQVIEDALRAPYPPDAADIRKKPENIGAEARQG